MMDGSSLRRRSVNFHSPIGQLIVTIAAAAAAAAAEAAKPLYP